MCALMLNFVRLFSDTRSVELQQCAGGFGNRNVALAEVRLCGRGLVLELL